MKKLLLIISLFLSCTANADQKDKLIDAENQYRELIQNKGDLNKTIEAARTIYQISRRVYGSRSQQYANATYNLAKLYDQKGGDGKDYAVGQGRLDAEREASTLYKKYFRIQNLNKAPKDIHYLNKYVPYLVAYYNSHPGNAYLDISEKFLEIAYKLNLPNAELASLELYNGIIITKSLGIRFAFKNFQKAVTLYEAISETHAVEFTESLFWLSRYEMGMRKYDLAEAHLTKAVNALVDPNPKTQMLKNEALQLLAITKLRAGNREAAEEYYKQIITPEDHMGYLVAINRPESYRPMNNAFLQSIPAYVQVTYDVDMFGKTFNIEVPFIAKLRRNILLPETFIEYEEYVRTLVSNIHFLPPHRNGEKTYVRNVVEELYFPPNLAY